MHASLRNLRSFPALWPAVLLLAGCGGTHLTPTFPVSNNLLRPDRVVVSDFAVSPDGSEGIGAPDTQTPEDIRIGRMFAKALTDSLIEELRKRGITADREGKPVSLKPDTASIKGRFLRADGSLLTGFNLGADRVRAQVQILQGTGLDLSVVSEGQISTPNNLRSGIGKSDDTAIFPVVEADARTMANAIADRIADYYRRQGWIKT